MLPEGELPSWPFDYYDAAGRRMLEGIRDWCREGGFAVVQDDRPCSLSGRAGDC
jgi:hypothetical protein